MTFFLLSLLLAMATSVKAQEATESAVVITLEKVTDASDESEENATQILRNLENLVRDSDQSEQIKTQYDGVTSKARGFVGQVTSLKEDSFKIVTPSGEELLIAPDKSTVLVKKGEAVTGDSVKLAEWVAVDDWLVLIGIQSGETFQPRRVLVSSDSLEPSETFVARGIIKTSQKNKLDIEIVGENAVETFNLTKAMNLVDQDNETITTKDLSPGASVLLIGKMVKKKRDLQTVRLL